MEIYDTTLRDGAQNQEVNLNIHEKLEIAKALDEFGVDYIELGWPGSNEKELQAFLEASKLKLKKSKITAFGSTRRISLSAEEDANLKAILDSKASVAAIFGKSWLLHVEKQLKATPEENLEAIKDTIAFLIKNNLKVIYDAEHFFDGYKDNKVYALSTLKAAAESGAKTIVLCDTNGGILPWELEQIIKEVQSYLKENNLNVKLGIHTHNDSGNAVANTLLAVQLGIEHIQGTINGLGERAGNADLCQVLPNLAIKMNKSLNVNLKSLTHLSNLVYTLTNMHPNHNQPFTGKNAFSHKGGIHVDAISKGASYEHINPELVGNKREIILSDLSGKANIVEVVKKFGYDADKNDIRIKNMLKELESLEAKGYDIGSLESEQFLLTEKHFGNPKNFFEIKNWDIRTRKINNKEFSECILTGIVKGKEQEVLATVEGGPVDAIYKALKKLLADYKEISSLKLINYKVMIAEDKGVESSVRVYIELKNSDEELGSIGVSTNILEASLEAIKKGFIYYLQKHLNN